MFSVIICSVDPVKFAQIERHYQQLFDSEPYELIGIHDARSLSEGYNRGLAQSKGEFVIFCHDDIEFISPGEWLTRLKNHLARFDIVGLAGTTRVIYPLWHSAGPPYIFGQIAHVGGKPDWPEPYSINIYSRPSPVVSGIQALDGLFIAVRREVLERVKFDDKTFTGFHCYDVDFTFSAYLEGFKLAVACDLPVIHGSGGNFKQDWRREATKFLHKHDPRLAPAKGRQFKVQRIAAKTREELVKLMLPNNLSVMSDADAKSSTVTLHQLLGTAREHLDAGRLDQAEIICRQVLDHNPDQPRAWHLSGRIALQKGQLQTAEDLIRRTISLNPDAAIFYDSLGMVLKTQGRLPEAVQAYQAALKLKPDYAQVHSHLGDVLLTQQQLEPAIQAYHSALHFKPNYAEAHFHLGIALKKSGNFREAIGEYHQALQLKPGVAEVYNNLGNAWHALKEFDQAIDEYRLAIKYKPDYPEAHNNLGHALYVLGRLNEAIEVYQNALQLKQADAQTYCSLANVLKDNGQFSEAVTACRMVLNIQPDYVDAWINLGGILFDCGKLDESIEAFERALKIKPDITEVYHNLGIAYKDAGRIQDALAASRKAINLEPDNPTLHANLMYLLYIDPASTPQDIHRELMNWGRIHGAPLKNFVQPDINDRDPERQLKIGYVSPDFKVHSVSYFICSLLADHDPNQVEVFCYANVKKPDQVTCWFKDTVYHWRDIYKLGDQEAAELIRADQIDILVDLAGHTTDTRLMLFARKPAPIQVTYLGYPGSTGLETMDYRFTDTFADPLGQSDAYYTEKLLRLPDTFLCYQPPQTAPTSGPLPALSAGHITFGCMNMMPKINAKLVELWARILQQVPASVILIKNHSLASAEVKRDLLELFTTASISPERLKLCGWIDSLAEHLDLYNQIDLCLDTYPYHGTTTTCEALYMGAPVITLAGQMHLSRVGVSLLSNVGLPELIARTPEEYVQIATKLAGDLPRLAEIRRTLRQRMEASPLMDAKRFARNVEAAYREMWHKWCGDAVNRIESR